MLGRRGGIAERGKLRHVRELVGGQRRIEPPAPAPPLKLVTAVELLWIEREQKTDDDEIEVQVQFATRREPEALGIAGKRQDFSIPARAMRPSDRHPSDTPQRGPSAGR